MPLLKIDPWSSENEWRDESARVLAGLLAMPAVERGKMPRTEIEDLTSEDQETFYASLVPDAVKESWATVLSSATAAISTTGAAAKSRMVGLITTTTTVITGPAPGGDSWIAAAVVGTVSTMVVAIVLDLLVSLLAPAWAGPASNLGPAIAMLACMLARRPRAGRVCAGWMVMVVIALLVSATTR